MRAYLILLYMQYIVTATYPVNDYNSYTEFYGLNMTAKKKYEKWKGKPLFMIQICKCTCCRVFTGLPLFCKLNNLFLIGEF